MSRTLTITEEENPNSKKLKITGIKYSSDIIDESIPKPLPNGVFFMLLVGKPKSGKTTFLINLLAKRGRFYNKKFDKIYVFSPSIFGGNLEDNIFDSLPEEQKYKDLDDLDDIISEIYGGTEKILMILDDVQAELKGDILNTLLDLVNNRRHYTSQGISIILTSQVYNQIPLKIRKGVSNIVFWSSKNKKEIKSIHEEYLSFLDDKELKDILKYTWQKTHDFLFIDTYAQQDNMLYRNFNKLKY